VIDPIDLDTPDGRDLFKRTLHHGMWVIRHDIADDVFDDSYRMLREFFSQPRERKDLAGEAGSQGHTGYLPPPEGGREWKELFHWAPQLPDAHPLKARYPGRYPDSIWPEAQVPGITATLMALHDQMQATQLRVLATLGPMLGLHEDYFRDLVTDGPVVNRASHYLPVPEESATEKVWAVEHADFDLITMLPGASSEGLEALIDGEWVPVMPPPGHAVFNAGTALERLTGGAIPAPIHRVVARQSNAARISIVQFCHPTPWSILAPTSGEPDGSVLRHPGISAGDFFEQAMYERTRTKAALLADRGGRG
jgi:isopenicillin N synthase-like dioxygenase